MPAHTEPAATMALPQARDFAMSSNSTLPPEQHQQAHQSRSPSSASHASRAPPQLAHKEHDATISSDPRRISGAAPPLEYAGNNHSWPAKPSQRSPHSTSAQQPYSNLPDPRSIASQSQQYPRSMQARSVAHDSPEVGSSGYVSQAHREQRSSRRETPEGAGLSYQQYNPSRVSTAAGSAHASSSQGDYPLTVSRPPLRSRVFGLGPDLRPQTELVDPAFFPGGVVPAEAATLTGSTDSSKVQPTFSVELKAQSFDHRGYPVYSGRAATIRGVVRAKRSDNCEVAIKISAHTTSGSAAAVWDGVALQPPESGSERTVFQTAEKISASDGKVEYPSTATSEQDREENAVLAMPFHSNLPMGGSTRIVDGNVETVAVALPPSFEMSSEQDAREKAVLRNTGALGTGSGVGALGLASGAASIKTSRTKMTAMTLKDAVETGLQQVYRVGCFYRITFTVLKKKGSDRERKSSASFFKRGKTSSPTTGSSSSAGSGSSSSKKTKGSDTLSIPFVFLGETTTLPPPPSQLPPMPPTILLQPSMPLATGWTSEVATSKWSGMLLKTLKRNVEIELFLPEGKVIHAPSVTPILIILRPEDPEMLPQPGAVVAGTGQSQSNGGSPRSGLLAGTDEGSSLSIHRGGPVGGLGLNSAFNPADSSPLASPSIDGVNDPSRSLSGQEHALAEDNETLRGEAPANGEHSQQPNGNALTRLIRTSLSISRQNTRDPSSPSSTAHGAPPSGNQQSMRALKKKSSRSTFTFNRRPNTAPSQASSDGSPANTEMSYTVRGGGGGSSSGASGARLDLPGLVRVSLLQNIYYSSSSVNEPPKNKRRLVSVADMEEVDLAKLLDGREAGGLLPGGPEAVAQVERAKQQGVRVLRGLIKVGREATPSFRVQGIELKYAVKVDLLPFNAKSGHRAKYHASSPPRTPPGRPSMQSTFGFNSALGGASTTGESSGQGSATSKNKALATNPALQQASPALGSAQWSPGRQLGQHASYAHSHHESNAPMASGMTTASQSMRDMSSIYHGKSSFAGSEAGWTRRSPSDQTVLGPENAKLHKTVGALWVNVRLVKGRGAL